MKLVDVIRERHGRAADEDVGVKAAFAQKIEYDPSQFLVSAIANTSDVDLQDEVVVPEGCDRDGYGKPRYLATGRAIFLNHDYATLPVGTLRNAKLIDGAWWTQFALHGKTRESADLRTLFAMGDENPVRGVSIGFVRLDGGQPTKEEVAKYGPASYVTRRWLWLELSVTPMPANPAAWIQDVQTASLPDDTARNLETFVTKGLIARETAANLGLVYKRAVPVTRQVAVA